MQIKAGNALAYRAQQVRRNRAETACHQVRRVAEFSVRSINGCGVANLNSGHRRNINHGHVHGDISNYGREHTANQHLAPVAEPAMNALCISRCKYSDARSLLWHET